MNILDITIDFETTSLSPTAAIISIGAVAWSRYQQDTPFLSYKAKSGDNRVEFQQFVDLRSAFLDGFTFDKSTADWWAQQSAEAKASLLKKEGNIFSIEKSVKILFEWINSLADGYDAVCLWSQGTDFDIAILKNVCYKYNIPMPVKHTQFRDHRTYALEAAEILNGFTGDAVAKPKKAYEMVKEYVEPGAKAHDPIFDCRKSIYTTWQFMNLFKKNLKIIP